MESYYQVYQSLPENRKIMYPLIILFIFLFLSRILINLNHIFSLLISVLIVMWLITNDAFNQVERVAEESEQTNYLQGILQIDSYDTINDDHIVRPPVFGYHLDKDYKITDFYYRLRDYANFNISSYKKSMFNSNNLLGLEEFVNHLDHSIKNPQQILEQAEVEFRDALNNLHSLIYSIPSTKLTNYTFNNALKKLEFLLIQHLDNIKNLAKLKFDTCQLNCDSKPIHDYHAYNNDNKSKGYSQHFSVY